MANGIQHVRPAVRTSTACFGVGAGKQISRTFTRCSPLAFRRVRRLSRLHCRQRLRSFQRQAASRGEQDPRHVRQCLQCRFQSQRRSAAGNIRLAEMTSIDVGTGPHAFPTAYGIAPDPNNAPAFAHGDTWFNHTYYNNPTWAASPLPPASCMRSGTLSGSSMVICRDDVQNASGAYAYSHPSLSSNHDSFEYSVMTYRGYPGARSSTRHGEGISVHSDAGRYPALQCLYGANFDYNSGNTVYTFSSQDRRHVDRWQEPGRDLPPQDLSDDVGRRRQRHHTISRTTKRMQSSISIRERGRRHGESTTRRSRHSNPGTISPAAASPMRNCSPETTMAGSRMPSAARQRSRSAAMLSPTRCSEMPATIIWPGRRRMDALVGGRERDIILGMPTPTFRLQGRQGERKRRQA